MSKFITITALMSVLFLFTSCSSTVTEETLVRNTYAIKVSYSPETRIMNGSENVAYINDKQMDKLYFHLYPNQYRDKITSMEYNSFEGSYPKGFNEGYIEISDVMIEGQKGIYKIDKMMLEIEIPKNLKENNNLNIEITFKSLLPEAKTRFGIFEGLTHSSYWYPILAVNDASKGWDKAGFYKIGESSNSEVADYNVQITLPKNQVIIATGEKLKEKNLLNGNKTVIFKESNIRDFSWFSSSDFKVKDKNNGKLSLKYYYTNEKTDTPDEVLDRAESIFDFYNTNFGEYPYKQFSIIKTKVATSEFPEIITITNDNLSSETLMRSALGHEISHQWWYLAVGNNQREEPWLDEAFASYSLHLYNSSLFGNLSTQLDMVERIPEQKYSLPVDSPVYKFDKMSEYGDMVYNLGTLVLYDLNNRMGNDLFYKILKTYYDSYKFKNATVSDFIGIVKQVAGKENADWLQIQLTTIEHQAMSKDEKVKIQSSIINNEQSKLNNGELFTINGISFGEKYLYQPIRFKNPEEMKSYETFMPILKIPNINGLNLNLIEMTPEQKYLKRIGSGKYIKQKYDIMQYKDVAGYVYVYGEQRVNKQFLMIFVFPFLTSNPGYTVYDLVATSGILDKDSDVYYFSNDKGNHTAYNLDYKGNKFGVYIFTNIKGDKERILEITKEINGHLSN